MKITKKIIEKLENMLCEKLEGIGRKWGSCTSIHIERANTEQLKYLQDNNISFYAESNLYWILQTIDQDILINPKFKSTILFSGCLFLIPKEFAEKALVLGSLP